MTPRQKWLSLIFLLLAQFMIVLDVSIVNISLPSIQKTFGLSVSGLQGIVTAYTLAFGGFLLLGGRAADLYGRKRIFIGGVIGFTLLSLLVGFTPSAAFLIPLRAVQGFFAAFMSPAALSIILATFENPERRARAISYWSAISASGATAGLIFGGILTQFLSWRWNFFVNVPIGIIVAIAAWRLVPAHEAQETDRTLDLPGAFLATAGIMLLVLGLSQANTWGWTATYTLAALGGAVVLLGLFVWNEARAPHPLLPGSIFTVGNVALADFIMFPIAGALFSLFFFLSLYVQNVLQYSPLFSGLAFLPISVTIALCAILAPNLIRRIGFKYFLVGAPLLLAVGLYFFAHISVHESYWSLLPWFILSGAGMGFSFVSLLIAATTGVPPQESGLASGMVTTAQQVGGSIGLSILTAVAAIGSASVAHAQSPQAAVTGFHYAFYVALAFALIASAAALFLKPNPQTNPRH